MLTAPSHATLTTTLFAAAILGGGLIGGFSPSAGEWLGGFVDPLILLLVGVLFFTLRLEGLGALRKAPKTVAIAVGTNFLLIPVIALALTAFLPNDALRLGVLIYCLAPCTDWFLGFTRLAGGDTTTGAALIPVQLTLQLALYPLWLALFAGEQVESTFASAGSSLITWFVVPAGIALALRLILRFVLPERARGVIVASVDRAMPAAIAAVIVAIFASNIETILSDLTSFAWVLVVVFVFFVCTFALGEGIAKLFTLEHGQHAVLTMTTSARNAPLMLALTTVALPDQPLVAAAIVLGMLIEFPHLTAVTHLLRRRGPAQDSGDRPLVHAAPST